MNTSEGLSWVEKYRPRSFSAVIGQNQAVRVLSTAVKNRTGLNVLLSGPSGCGKTSLGEIFAQAVMCREPQPDGSGCGVCDSCRSLRADWHPNRHEINSGTEGNLENIRELLGELEQAPRYGRVHTMLFNEAHRLSPAAREALLDPLEKHDADTAFIFTLIDASKFGLPFRSRCRDIRLHPISIADRLVFLEGIQAGEGLEIEPSAAVLLARHTPSLRDLARRLQAVAEITDGAHITEAAARDLLLREGPRALLLYLAAAAVGDWDGQLTNLREAEGSPSTKVDALRQILLHLKLRRVGPVTSRSLEVPFEGLLDDAVLKDIISGLERRAEWLAVPFPVLFDQVLEFWSFWPPEITETELETQAVRFHDRLTLGEVDAGGQLAAPSRSQITKLSELPPIKRRARRANWGFASSPAEYLSAAQAKQIYEAASFLVQRHGVTFNAKLELETPTTGDPDAHSAMISELARQLGQDVKIWASKLRLDEHIREFHRLVVQEAPPGRGYVSTIIFHCPPELEQRIRTWIGKFLSEQGLTLSTGEGGQLEVSQPRKVSGKVALHWELVRHLWRGLDPSLLLGGQSLVDILKVPARQRRPSGVVLGHRFATSRSLSSSRRIGAAVEGYSIGSAWEDQAWDFLFTGWELDSFKAAILVSEQQAQIAADRDRDMQASADSLTRQILTSLAGRASHATKKVAENRRFPWTKDGDSAPEI